MITGMTGKYRRKMDESEVHGREMADVLTSEIMYKFKADDDTDFHVEFDFDGRIPDTGVDDPRGWALLSIESSYTDLANELRGRAGDVLNAVDGLRAGWYPSAPLHRSTLKRHANNLTAVVDQMTADAVAADQNAASEIETAQAWFYSMALYAVADVPYDVEEADIYERAEAVKTGTGWDAVHNRNR